MHGTGKLYLNAHETWEGRLSKDTVHRLGVLKHSDGTRRAAIYRHNQRVCFIDELQPGARILLLNPEHAIHHTSAYILSSCQKQGRYRVKFEADGFVRVSQ